MAISLPVLQRSTKNHKFLVQSIHSTVFSELDDSDYSESHLLREGIWQRCARVLYDICADYRSKTDGKTSLANRNAERLFLLLDISIYSESHLLREPRDFSTEYLAALRASFS